MPNRPGDAPVHPHCAPAGTSDLFTWSGGGIVLLAERAGERWVVARGWRRDDRLTDVRRWSFAESSALAGQVRRLAQEATGEASAARDAGAAALAWAAVD